MLSYVVARLTALIFVYALSNRFCRPSLSMIRGPKSRSFIYGNLLDLLQRPTGEADFAWQSQYGNVVRFKGVFGEDWLLITDPEVLRRMLHTATYSYSKSPSIRLIVQLIGGAGIIWSEGEDHKRQRSIMLPGFGLKECKVFFPIFWDCADSISTKWLGVIGNQDSNDQSDAVVIDVQAWMSRGTLDTIGSAAFGVQFGTTRDDLHPLAKVYENFMGDICGSPSAEQIFMQAASKYIPMTVLQWLAESNPNPRLVRARDVKDMSTRVSNELLQEKADALLQGRGSRDIFTLLVKANMDASTKKKLSNEELLAGMRTILIAGYETTATTVSFILLELARNPKVHSRLRDKIRKIEATSLEHGDPELTVSDLDTMPYLNAVIKEGLQFHPVVPHMMRVAEQDDTFPLSKPILTERGDTINQVLIPRSTEIVVSIAAYNRNKDLWGNDAHEFRPDRWLDGTINDKTFVGIGGYSNLMTFSTGIRSCIGWHFALSEIQVFLSMLVGKFEFAMTDEVERIVRRPSLVMVPVVDGELEFDVRIPLAVSLAGAG